MKCLLSVSLTAALAVVAELAMSNILQSPPLQKGVSVQMAVTDNAVAMPGADNENAWIVAVTANGQLYFGTQAVSADSLTEKMKATPRKRDQKLYIKADARAQFSSVEKVLEAGRQVWFDAPVLLTSQTGSAEPGATVPPKGLEVQVGAAASPESPVVRVLESKQEPAVEINNQRIALTSLPGAVSQAFQSRETKAVHLIASGTLPFARAVQVIDVCRAAGAKVILDTPGL